ncbi:hypothetical protein [Qipengyuania gaetbuli]|uniref:DUF7079 family protein n=1 Tax=Qipengyuania gaetbuli TaxID=266952 RepID=UPI001CFE96BC|nr:hypothetical protein [Qipengyuania gaetbuli]
MAQGARGLNSGEASRQIEPRRLAAWTVLANLFLDTEHSDEIRLCLARDLRETGYSSGELEDILRREVAPVFGSNLLSMAGEWALWDEDEVAEIMEREFLSRKRLTPSQWVVGRLTNAMVRRDLRKLMRLA